MKKLSLWLLFVALGFSAAFGTAAFAAEAERFDASGEVLSVDPLYSRITIRHQAIKNFSSDADTEFPVASADLLKNIVKGDLVDFTIVDEKGDTRLEKITKTGVAPPREERLKLGQAVQDVLVGTGEVAKGVASPLPPAHEIVSGAVGATTDATGAVLEKAEGPEVKKKF